MGRERERLRRKDSLYGKSIAESRVSQLQLTNNLLEGFTQVTFCAKAPPMIGPVTEPTLHMALIIPNHCPLSLSGTKSVTTISVSAISPPPPIPCSERPTSRGPKFFETPATIAPTRKKTRATMMTCLRPKMCEKLAKLGWKMVEHSRKEVPAQNASIAVPFSFCAIIWTGINTLTLLERCNDDIREGLPARRQRDWSHRGLPSMLSLQECRRPHIAVSMA